jgi:hypothetical protein
MKIQGLKPVSNMNTKRKPKRFFLEVLSTFFLVSILLPQLASATVLFSDNFDLDGTTVPPTVQVTIGDDEGQSKLDVGKAKFGKVKDGQNWLSDDDDEDHR